MKNENKNCWNCEYYKAYYTKGICSYDNTFTGYCRCKNEIVKNSNFCDKWSKRYRMKKIREGLRKKVLERISEDISMIRQIMEEEQKEDFKQN